MRPFILSASLAGALALGALMFCQPSEIPAQPKKMPPVPTLIKTQGPSLPVTQVVLFSSGVGYFQREGDVTGTATLDLSFPVSDINDLLKSLVLQDLGGGQIKAVGYDSFDPVDKTLKSFALDLTKNPTFAQILQQARGEKVEIDWQGQAIKGSIVGVEKQRQAVSKENVVEVDVINVLTNDGLRNLPLNQVQRVRLLNPYLDSELKHALEVLAQSHDTHKRMVSLSFTGEGKRPVKVGYVIENPLWKTSYRLVLDKETKPFLQGWAIVDNATDEDWQNVHVTLVSGRPISFQMNLYQPIYVPRPWVELELFGNIRPPTYGGALDVKSKGADGAVARDEMRRAGLAPEAARPLAAPFAPAKPLDLQQGVSAGATAQEVGDFFQYIVQQPVSLGRQRSAMLPIVNQGIEGSRLSIYNAAVQAKHPLLGLKLKNTTNLHLMQGPITIFDGSTYAGDARILDLQPNEERLLSYALDQGVEVEPVGQSTPDQLVSVKVVKGILYATYKLRQTKTYNVKNRSGHDRVLLIEHPFRADWKFVGAKEPTERSRDVYRFQVAVPAGKSASQEVVEEQGRVNQIVLTNADDQTIRLFLTSKVTSPKVKEALEKAISLKVKLAETQREIGDVNTQIKALAEDQARIRANMERVPQNSAPYQRYLKKLDEQETQIEGFQDHVKTLRRREDEQRRGFEAYLLSLNLEE